MLTALKSLAPAPRGRRREPAWKRPAAALPLAVCEALLGICSRLHEAAPGSRAAACNARRKRHVQWLLHTVLVLQLVGSERF